MEGPQMVVQHLHRGILGLWTNVTIKCLLRGRSRRLQTVLQLAVIIPEWHRVVGGEQKCIMLRLNVVEELLAGLEIGLCAVDTDPVRESKKGIRRRCPDPAALHWQHQPRSSSAHVFVQERRGVLPLATFGRRTVRTRTVVGRPVRGPHQMIGDSSWVMKMGTLVLLLLLLLVVLHVRRESCGRVIPAIADGALEGFAVVVRLHVDLEVVTEREGERKRSWRLNNPVVN